MADRSAPPRPLPAQSWQRGCGQAVMVLGIALTMLSGLCTVGMTIADLSADGHHGGEVDLTGIQYVLGAPFIVIGALIWWGGWAVGRKGRATAAPAGPGPRDDGPGASPRAGDR